MKPASKPRKPREERDPTPEQVALITEYVRQRNELGHRRQPDPVTGIRHPLELADFLRMAKEIGFWRMRKDIEATAALYAKRNAPPVRFVAYPPSASDPAPLFESWRDFLDRVTWTKLRRFCLDRAHRANRLRLCSDPKLRVEGYHVWRVICEAKGRCMHCGSLAVEGVMPGGKWGLIGRRVGSLEHILPRYRGGDNDFANLGWSCLWCNNLDREQERKKGLTAWGALDSGGFHPPLRREPDRKRSEAMVAAKYRAATGHEWKGDVAAFAAQEIPHGFERDDVEDEMFPDHEYPQATAMWRDAFS